MKRSMKWSGLLLVLLCAGAFAQDALPKYLQLARELVQNVKPENNLYHYETSNRYTRFPSDFLSFGYSVHTDCTGFVEDMLSRGNGIGLRFSTRMFADRYSIIDWVDGIERGEMFDKVGRIQDARVGDLFLWKFLPKLKSSGTIFNGHATILDTAPRKVDVPRQGLPPETEQWEVWILDSSSEPKGTDDSRYIASAALPPANDGKRQRVTGVGRGRMFIYTDVNGTIKGLSLSFPQSRVYWDGSDLHMLLARPRGV